MKEKPNYAELEKRIDFTALGGRLGQLRVAWKCINEALIIARRHKAHWLAVDHELDQTLTAITRHLGRIQIIQCQRPTREDEP